MIRQITTTLFIVYLIASIGPILYKTNMPMFDMYELVGVIFLPIVYIIVGLQLMSFYIEEVPEKKRILFKFYYLLSVLASAFLQIISTLAFSPGGPLTLKESPLVYIIPIAVSIAAFQVLAEKLQGNSTEQNGAPNLNQPFSQDSNR